MPGYDKDTQYYKDPIPNRIPTLAHALTACLHVSAPRLLQRIPENAIPGTTFVYGYSNIPRRKPHSNRVQRQPVIPNTGIIGL